jgi:hypothetical protein
MGMPMETWPQRHRITVDEYYRMADLGLLAPDARVELIEGEIIDMRQSVAHTAASSISSLICSYPQSPTAQSSASRVPSV